MNKVTQRIPSLELARGFTVLMIAPIHTVMLYSESDVHQTLMGKLLAFIAEGPGAQLFMLLMGFYFSFRQPTFKKTISRAALLLATGYGLNAVKFVLPLSLGLLPKDFLAYLDIESGPKGILQLLLIGDILHFAALALCILYIVRKPRCYFYISLALSITICFLSPLFWDASSNNQPLNYFLQLTGGRPPRVFFPLMPWLVYPLTGMIIGYYFPNNGNGIFTKCGNIGILLLITGFLSKTLLIKEGSPSFYRTQPADTIQHLGIVLSSMAVWYWLYRNTAANLFFRLLKYMSRHITQIYVIQWIIICWMLPLFGYQELNFDVTLIAILLISCLTFFISVLLNLKVNAKQDI